MVVSSVEARAVPAVGELVALGRARGLAAVGVTSAEPFASTRRDLDDRKAKGLHGGMAFTYRNPARSTEPERALAGARALVVGAWPYQQGRAGTAVGPGTYGVVARYAREDHYAALRAALEAIAGRLRGDGWRARVLADDNALVDRAAARRAGLGWYGKNANLLLPGQGSWFVLGSVITDAPLPTATPGDQVPDGCGTCTRCLDGCPTGAIVAPGVVDARRCLAWLLQADGPFSPQHRVALGDRIYGCDDCQEVCPPNRRTARRLQSASSSAPPPSAPDRRSGVPPTGGLPPVPGPSAGAPGEGVGGDAFDPPLRGDAAPSRGPEAGQLGGGGAHVDVLEMLRLGDDELLARFGRWYIPRREARYLRRNALVVLGNVGDPADPEVLDAVRRALADGDPIVRGHAVWAARRLGRPDLVAPLAGDPDPLVQDELAADVEVRSA